MYVNQIDNLFDTILNNFNIYLLKEKFIEKILLDANFVKYQNDILLFIKKFIDKLNIDEIIIIVKKTEYVNTILNIIKRYCAYYIYLSIAYYYKATRDLYIINIIESGKYQKDSVIELNNFFNSENNSKIVTFFIDIKNILFLTELKTIDKIKIILGNNPVKYESTINLFNDLGEDYIVEYFLLSDNYHSIIKTLIFKQIYIKEDKNDINKLLNELDKKDAEYKYIDIILSNQKKIVDFNFIQKFVNLEYATTYKYNLPKIANDIYMYLSDVRDTKEILLKNKDDFINYLFTNNILIPISEDFLRFHKDTEKYMPENISETVALKEKNDTKIKYIISKINKVKNYNSHLLDTNPKFKLEIKNLFYKTMENQDAVLFNDNEEVNIIKKLNLANLPNNKDLLIDLENFRKYSYLNYKNSSRDSIKIRPYKTIQAIRYTNFKYTNNTNKIDIRIGHNNIDMNIVGVALNPSLMSLDCFKIEDLINVRDVSKKINNETNGFKIFLNIMNHLFLLKNASIPKKIYYWLFDTKIDKPLLDTYVDYNINETDKVIKLMLEQIYNTYILIIKQKFIHYIDTIDTMNNWYFEKLFRFYNKKYFNFELDIKVKNNIIEKVITEKIKELKIIEDIDIINKDEIIILPSIPNITVSKDIIKLGEKKSNITLESLKLNIAVCHHYIKWENINKMSKNTDMFNQAIFEFVKQYVKLNESSENICKSCNEIIPMQKFEVTGTYVDELDTFLTTSIIVNINLDQMIKYKQYMRCIRNIEKNIERFANALNIYYYIGNTPIVKLERKLIVKDTIDLILLHTEWLKKQSKNRNEEVTKKYGITKELTNLFFFELSDDIFLTSSLDTDYYKQIKYNNIMAYLVMFIILGVNTGQLLNFKEDKQYNYFFYTKIGHTLFNNLYIRMNQKQKILVTSIPLFAYILYYISGCMIKYKLWLWNDSKIETKDKPLYYIMLQKIIIGTVLDLINSVVEANTDTNKNYLYEIINARFTNKITKTYNDKLTIKKIEENIKKFINIDVNNKITYIKKKIDLIELNNTSYIYNNNNRFDNCASGITSYNILIKKLDKVDDNISYLTSCPDGKFHLWAFISNDLVCSLCNATYSLLIKNDKNHNKNSEYLQKIKLINLIKLSQKYCIDGEIHNFDDKNKCNKCNNSIDNKYTDKQLFELEKNLEKKNTNNALTNINNIKELYEENKLKIKKTKNIVNHLLKKYHKLTNDNLDNYINSFTHKLSKILGDKIKINNYYSYFNDTLYIIDHDHLGITLPDNKIINVLLSEDKIIFIDNHKLFNKDIIYYKDKSKNIYVYYDAITLQYLGYSENNKDIKKNRNNASLKVELSVKDMLINLGYENKYLNMEYYNDNTNNHDLILQILRNRLNNLKQILNKTQSLIFELKNKTKISVSNNGKNEIINEFIKKIKNLNTDGIFTFCSEISNKIAINYDISENININISSTKYVNIANINLLQNSDCKLIFYLVYNLNKLLDNNQSSVLTEVAFFIVKIIKYMYDLYYIPYSNYKIRQFSYLITNDKSEYIDENILGNYNELIHENENENENQNENENNNRIDNKEENEAIDIDEYDLNDEDEDAAIDEDFNTD